MDSIHLSRRFERGGTIIAEKISAAAPPITGIAEIPAFVIVWVMFPIPRFIFFLIFEFPVFVFPFGLFTFKISHFG